MSDCIHGRFNVKANVIRLQRDIHSHPENKADNYQLEINVICDECKTPFEFMGIPMGMSFKGPACSVDRLEARLAIKPSIDREE